jgi:hypothetical protein
MRTMNSLLYLCLVVTLCGFGGEPFKLVLANNGLTPVQAGAEQAAAELSAAAPGLSIVVLTRPTNGGTAWQVEYR